MIQLPIVRLLYYYSSVLGSIGSGGGSSDRGGIGRISRRMKMFCRVSLLLLSAYDTVVTGEVIDEVTTHEKVELSAVENGRLVGLGLGLCLGGCLVGYVIYYLITTFVKAGTTKCQICQHCKTANSEKRIMVTDLSMATVRAVIKEVKELYNITLTELQVYSTLQCWNCCKLQFDGDGKVTVTNQLYEEDGVHEYQQEETIFVNKSAKVSPRNYHTSLNFRDGTPQYLMEIMLPLLLEQKSKTKNRHNKFRQDNTRYHCCNGENCPYDKKLNALKVPTSRYPVDYEFNVPTDIRCRGCINDDVQKRIAMDGMEVIGAYFNPHYNESSKNPLFNQKILFYPPAIGGEAPKNTPIQSYIPDDMDSKEAEAALPIIDEFRSVYRERGAESQIRCNEEEEEDEDDDNMPLPLTDDELKESDNKVQTLKKDIRGTNLLLSINLSSCTVQNNGTERPPAVPREQHFVFATQQPGQDNTDFHYKICNNEPEGKLRVRQRVFFVDRNGDPLIQRITFDSAINIQELQSKIKSYQQSGKLACISMPLTRPSGTKSIRLVEKNGQDLLNGRKGTMLPNHIEGNRYKAGNDGKRKYKVACATVLVNFMEHVERGKNVFLCPGISQDNQQRFMNHWKFCQEVTKYWKDESTNALERMQQKSKERKQKRKSDENEKAGKKNKNV